MKTYFFLIIFMCISLNLILAQNIFTSVDPEREVIVQLKNGTYTPPQNNHTGSLEDFTFNSASLKTLLRQNNVEEISQLIPGFTQEDRVKTTRSGEQVMISDWSNYYVIRIRDKEIRNNLISNLETEQDILAAEPNNWLQSFTIPNDTYFYKQWYLKNDGTPQQGNGTIGADIRATEAWDITTGINDVKVAIVDYGLNLHTEYSSRLSGDPPSAEFHGTRIAGIIGASGNNSTGISGIAWNVGLINADYGGGTTAEAVASIIRAFNYGAYILNNSWGDPSGYTSTLRQVFADAYKINIVSIAAMGNDYQQPVVNYPAAFKQGVIAVGGTDNNDIVSPFSTIGSWIDVSAPGGKDNPADENDIYSTYLGNDYNYGSGTSYSAPIVAGISALMLSIDLPGIILDDDDVENIIEWSAEDKFTPGFDIYYGWGRVDVRKALDKLLLPYEIHHYSTSGGTIFGNPVGIYPFSFYGVDGLPDGNLYHVNRYEVRKTVNFSSKPEKKFGAEDI